MGTYLHHFKTLKEFEDAYRGDITATAITVSGAGILSSCNDWNHTVESHDLDGKYILDREGNVEITTCDGQGPGTQHVRIFKNGNRELYDYYYDGNWGSEVDGYVAYIQDPSSAYAAGDGECYVSSIEYDESKYIEPWVSVAEEECVNKFSAKLPEWEIPGSPDFDFEYVGGYDWGAATS